ncbi:MAG: hypothetical protein A3D31_09010 [Candidatus Fluviicola riflensis]|nr:MAG: hypothetical protein CHH17_13420 [Candidatus Fluviicola riflensis]OGS77150.1 MAG: hypothetical protein A3D31_09010 [Candidatus Fluviicola riflensis]OGS82085.1 MAG: hypothetical protein A2724_17955 [Fluviicola sp. RIFCSPHIGHO2_01_FULL_43_53]OGS87779.1 MAG: hypothetical protein A3E30_15390 [Fluviicola sp. RIFCSPHIGHO2_12_FULL_43_24]
MKTRWYLMVLLLFAGLSVQAQTDQDKKEVMQLCLDLPALQPYFHTEQPERLPIIIKNNGKISPISLNKFGKPVVYMSPDDIDAKGTLTALEFMRFEVTTESATIMLRYNIEGLMVTILLKKVKGVWTVTDSKLVER